jgi:predicted flap endonuclease-1-like 5' DNA nuclease/uncharacterized membrane protein (UPF0127 family)
MIAAFKFDGWMWLAAVVAFLVGWFLNYFLGWRWGKQKEEVLRRVVETSSDESTRIRTLSDEHALALKSKDDALLKLRGDQENELNALRADRDKAMTLVKEREAELGSVKAESTKLQGLVGTVDTSKKELDDLRGQLTKQKSDYELAIGDWRKRAEAGEAAKAAAEKQASDYQGRIKSLEADHAKVVGDWQARVKTAETKTTEVQGLMGSAKADNDKVLLEWRTRAEKAEASVAAGSKASADWEARYKALEADRSKVASDWDARYKALEADRNKSIGEWQSRATTAEKQANDYQGRIKSLEADHAKVVGDWQARVKTAETKTTEVQGLMGSAKADNDKLLLEWRTRAEKAEASVAAGSKASADWEARYKALEADRSKVASDWDARYKALEADRNKLAADWDAKYKALEADRNKLNAEWDGRYKQLESDYSGRLSAVEGKHTEVQGLLSSVRNENTTAINDWTTRYASLQSDRDGGFSSRDAEIARLKAQLAEATAGPDDLLIIEGIGPKINAALRADGITRWVQVRDASQDRLRSAIEKAGITFAPSMTTWPKQAGYLAAGDRDGFAKYTEYLVSGQDPESYGGEAVGAAEVSSAQARGALYGSGNVEGNDDNDRRMNSDGSDNLLIIEGIGPKFNEALLKAGITTFAQVAGASQEQLRGAIEAAGMSFAPSMETWPQQASLLAKNDMAAFKTLTDQLISGRKQ